jgi:hypothetical protein
VECCTEGHPKYGTTTDLLCIKKSIKGRCCPTQITIQTHFLSFKMQVSISFIALSVLSLCAARAVPRFTPAGQALSPGPTDASWPTVPESLVAAYRASQNSTSGLTKRDVHCETSGGSPPAGDVNAAIHTLDAVAANSCQQSNGGGSFCTTMGCSGAACGTLCLLHCQSACSSFTFY